MRKLIAALAVAVALYIPIGAQAAESASTWRAGDVVPISIFCDDGEFLIAFVEEPNVEAANLSLEIAARAGACYMGPAVPMTLERLVAGPMDLNDASGEMGDVWKLAEGDFYTVLPSSMGPHQHEGV